MEISGRIKMIDETKAFGANGFRKREIVVTTDEQYPQHIMIEFTQDKCDLLDNFKLREAVKVAINLRGREWLNPQGETKYFNSVQGWRIERDNEQSGHQEPGSATEAYLNKPASTDKFEPNTNFKEDDDDGLPF